LGVRSTGAVRGVVSTVRDGVVVRTDERVEGAVLRSLARSDGATTRLSLRAPGIVRGRALSNDPSGTAERVERAAG
jgi:hypothetical protein